MGCPPDVKEDKNAVRVVTITTARLLSLLRRTYIYYSTPEHSWIDSCDTTGMNQSPAPIDLRCLSTRYAVSVAVLDDLNARRRAGAHNAELIDLLTQRDRGGLDRERACALVAELPPR